MILSKTTLPDGRIKEIYGWSHRYEYPKDSPGRGCGFVFGCDEQGNLLPPDNIHAQESQRRCLADLEAGRIEDKGTHEVSHVYYPCECGSGEEPSPEYDGHGIYMGSCCLRCRKQFMSRFRPSIKERYETFEPIDEDY